MATIRRVTDTIGFLATFSNECEFTLSLSKDKKFCEFSSNTDEFLYVMNKQELGVMRDFFAHAIDYMEDDDE